VALARSALARVVGSASELDELWQEGDDHDAWLTQIAALQSTLRGIATSNETCLRQHR
jgi:hypothetical protein